MRAIENRCGAPTTEHLPMRIGSGQMADKFDRVSGLDGREREMRNNGLIG